MNFQLINPSVLLLQLAADPDPNVKNGAELLDRLIKVGYKIIWLREAMVFKGALSSILASF